MHQNTLEHLAPGAHPELLAVAHPELLAVAHSELLAVAHPELLAVAHPELLAVLPMGGNEFRIFLHSAILTTDVSRPYWLLHLLYILKILFPFTTLLS